MLNFSKNMGKKKFLIAVILVGIAGIFALVAIKSKKQATAPSETVRQPITVTTQSVADSASLSETLNYPATIIGDQEVKITAKSAGNTLAVNFNIGQWVKAGSVLVKIDDTGNTLEAGDNGFRSSQLQQNQLAAEQAKESLSLAKKNYSNLKDAFDAQQHNPTAPQTVSKTQVDAAKKQIDIAELQYESSKVGYQGSIDNHLITSPIAGIVTQKNISLGDSIAVGQPIATISKTSNLKARFFVDQEQLSFLKSGLIISLKNNEGLRVPATIRNISPAADQTTKRFLIEAFPSAQDSLKLFSGTIATAEITNIRKPQNSQSIILPLSAITIGQNENYIFIADNDRAKKIIVTVTKVDGESAEIQTNLSQDSQIVTTGNKLLQDGESLSISK
jgi:RND family efflux transporter MFP subunit